MAARKKPNRILPKLKPCCYNVADCLQIRRASPYGPVCVRIGRDPNLVRARLAADRLELDDERQGQLHTAACGVPLPTQLRNGQKFVTGHKPKDVRLWIGHFYDDDMLLKEGAPIGLRAETRHPDAQVLPLNGPQPAPLPRRPLRDGRDCHFGVTAKAQARAARWHAAGVRRSATDGSSAGPFAAVAGAADLGACGCEQLTAASLSTGKRKAQAETTPAVDPEACDRRKRPAEKCPVGGFVTDFVAQERLVRQIEAHAHQCVGKLCLPSASMSRHGLAGRLVARCTRVDSCTASYTGSRSRIVWESSQPNPDGRRCSPRSGWSVAPSGLGPPSSAFRHSRAARRIGLVGDQRVAQLAQALLQRPQLLRPVRAPHALPPGRQEVLPRLPLLLRLRCVHGTLHAWRGLGVCIN